MNATVSKDGEIVLPEAIRRQDNIELGQEFEFQRIGPGDYRLHRRPPVPNEGLVDWLLACPERGFFLPIESESTDAPSSNSPR